MNLLYGVTRSSLIFLPTGTGASVQVAQERLKELGYVIRT